MDALTDVFMERKMKPWAVERADFANVHFRGGQGNSTAYMAEDFLGTGDRAKRGLDQAKEQMAIAKANAALARIKRDGPAPEGIPIWAIGEYRAPVAQLLLSEHN